MAMIISRRFKWPTDAAAFARAKKADGYWVSVEHGTFYSTVWWNGCSNDEEEGEEE